jgi:hypothetical protein
MGSWGPGWGLTRDHRAFPWSAAMATILSTLLGAETVALAIVAWLYFRSAASLSHYRGIADAEKFKLDCEQKAKAALGESERLSAQSGAVEQQIAAQRAKVAQYQQLLGNLKSAADLQQRIRSDTAKVQQLASTIGKLERASQLDEYLRTQEGAIASKKSEIEAFTAAVGEARSASEIHAKVVYLENYLAQLKADVEAVEEARGLQEFGYYRPHYDFDTSEEYKKQLDSVRKKQKEMLKSNTACACETNWTVDGSRREGQKMVNQQTKLMLRAFNGECDAAVGNARYDNVVSLESRITRSFDQINKLGATQRVRLQTEFRDLKHAELHLAHEYQEKKQEEREEQRRVREAMKEEEKAARETKKAREDAEKEESVKRHALEKARDELSRTAGQQTAKLEALVSKLENELQAAIDRKAKAIARAQLTKSGHVYILSNVGAFGEGVYKIGMTRRLEPLERVKELGAAPVPFPFDVHAMIYSEDAPALESKLHRHFDTRRVNLVNLRREFFRVSLDEVRAAVAQRFGHVTFVTVPQAAEYRQTLALRKQQKDPATLQIA